MNPSATPPALLGPTSNQLAAARSIAKDAPNGQALVIKRGPLSRTWRKDAPFGVNEFLQMQSGLSRPITLVGPRFHNDEQRLWDGFERDRDILEMWAAGELAADSEHVTECGDKRVVVEVPTNARVTPVMDRPAPLTLN